MDYLMYLENMLQFYQEGSIQHDNLLRTIESLMSCGNEFHETRDNNPLL